MSDDSDALANAGTVISNASLVPGRSAVSRAREDARAGAEVKGIIRKNNKKPFSMLTAAGKSARITSFHKRADKICSDYRECGLSASVIVVERKGTDPFHQSLLVIPKNCPMSRLMKMVSKNRIYSDFTKQESGVSQF